MAGVADELRHAGLAVFGPSAEAAQIEGSKSFAKEVMTAAGVPMPASLPVATAPCVVKADGLAAGKGVFVCRTADEVEGGCAGRSGARRPLVIEELLDGPEVVAVRALRRPPGPGARRRPGLQAGARRRRRPEHRRYGRLLPGRLARRSGRARRADPPTRDRRARAPRNAVRRLSLRRADGHRGRTARARVQRALRRPRDAGADSAALEGDLLEALARRGGRRPGRGASRRAGGCSRDGRPDRPELPGAQRLHRRPHRRGRPRPRRWAPSSSTEALRAATAISSRTADVSCRSQRSRRPSGRRAHEPMQPWTT